MLVFAVRVHVVFDKRAVLFLARLLGLVAVILEPDFDLCGRQIESIGQMFALLRTQILL